MQNHSDVDRMSDDSTDLMGVSGDTRISVNVQQVTSRYKTIQVTAKVFKLNLFVLTLLV